MSDYSKHRVEVQETDEQFEARIGAFASEVAA